MSYLLNRSPNVSLEECFGGVELHISSHNDLVARFGAKIKAAGGSYNACRGNSTTRFVHIPTKALSLIERVLATYKAECVILRGPSHLWADLTGEANHQGDWEGRRSKDVVLSKFSKHTLNAARPIDYVVGYLQGVASKFGAWQRAEELRLERIQIAEKRALAKAARERQSRLEGQAEALLMFAQAVISWQARTGDPTLNDLLPLARDAVAAVNDTTNTPAPTFGFARAVARP